MARIQPCLKKLGIDFAYFNGDRVYPRTVMKSDIALYLYINHFCLIWKSQNISFNDAIKEIKENFKKVDNNITLENVNSRFKYEFIPKKTESHLTNFFVYDLETHNTNRASPFILIFYRLGKSSGR